MEKTAAQVREFSKVAAATLRRLSEDNAELREKVASYEKRERAEKIASAMDEKGLEMGLDHKEKVAKILAHDNLTVLEEAISMSAPQGVKLASVHDDGTGEYDSSTDRASTNFFAGLTSLE